VQGVSVPQATTLDLGRAVRRLRNAHGMTIEGLADVSGMDRTYLQKAEVKGRNLSWEKLAGLASGLDMTIAELAAHADDEAKRNRDAGTEQSPSSEPPSR
jgi:transcriptional regulator with XRE-family HTH domain